MGTKEELLKALELSRQKGTALSGQELADRLQVSRMAVWKAVKALETEGYEILSVPGKGYRLAPRSDRLSPEGIKVYLRQPLVDIPVFTYPVTDSTNKRASAYAGEGFSGSALFVADSQTDGRGRLGRSFYSPAGSGIYFSFLFSSDAPLSVLNSVTPAAAVATAQSIEALTGISVGIKWVNDLYFNGKKICGILTEAITAMDEGCENKIIVGIGVNLSTNDFPDQLNNTAGALNCTVNRCQLVAETVNRLARFAEDPYDRNFMDYYSTHSVVMGRKVLLTRGSDCIIGRVAGFDENGGLILDREDGGKPEVFTGGEITLRFTE